MQTQDRRCNNGVPDSKMLFKILQAIALVWFESQMINHVMLVPTRSFFIKKWEVTTQIHCINIKSIRNNLSKMRQCGVCK